MSGTLNPAALSSSALAVVFAFMGLPAFQCQPQRAPDFVFPKAADRVLEIAHLAGIDIQDQATYIHQQVLDLRPIPGFRFTPVDFPTPILLPPALFGIEPLMHMDGLVVLVLTAGDITTPY